MEVLENKREVETLSQRLGKTRTIFDVPALTAKIQDLEQIAAQPEFWNDQTAAQQTLQELNDLKEHLQQYDQWQASLKSSR